MIWVLGALAKFVALVQVRNALNVRVALSKGPLRVEMDLPSGMTVQECVLRLDENLNVILEEFDAKNQQLTTAQAPTTIDEVALNNLPWKTMNQNPEGAWIFSNFPEAKQLVELLQARPDKTLVISAYRYLLSGATGQFVNRFKHKKESR